MKNPRSRSLPVPSHATCALALALATGTLPALHAQVLSPLTPGMSGGPTFFAGYELLTADTATGIPRWSTVVSSGGYHVREEPFSIHQTLTGAGGATYAESNARADVLGLGVSSSASASGMFTAIGSGAVVQIPADGRPHYGSLAAIGWSDNLLTGPGTMATVSLNLHLDGSETLTHSVTGPIPAIVLETGLFLSVQISYSLPGGGEVVTQFDGTYARSQGVVSTVLAMGLLTGFGGSGSRVITTPDFDVPLGIPWDMTLVLASAAAAGTTQGDGETSEAGMDFLHTLSLPVTGPVLNMDPGIIYAAPSMGIVANQSTAVPEPKTTAALVSGALMAFAAWRRYCRNASPI